MAPEPYATFTVSDDPSIGTCRPTRLAAGCGILSDVIVAGVARLLVAPLLLVSAAALAASFDGTYTGTLACPAFPNQPPLRVEIAVTVSGRMATYEQRATGTASGDLGAQESGSGSVSPSGELVLSGSCRGGFTCATEYRSDLSKTPVRLEGSQRWWFRSGDRERKCEVELKRQARSRASPRSAMRSSTSSMPTA
jgi:hypothetical protein